MLSRNFLASFSACLLLLGTASAQTGRVSEIVAYDDVRIEVIAEGSGPLVVLLPSRGRAAEDFDVVAAGIANGFLVTRAALPPFIATLGMMGVARV